MQKFFTTVAIKIGLNSKSAYFNKINRQTQKEISRRFIPSETLGAALFILEIVIL